MFNTYYRFCYKSCLKLIIDVVIDGVVIDGVVIDNVLLKMILKMLL